MNDASHFDKCKYMKIEKSRVEVLNDSEELVVAAVRLLNFGAVLCALCDDIFKLIFKRASALAQKYAKNASCTVEFAEDEVYEDMTRAFAPMGPPWE